MEFYLDDSEIVKDRNFKNVIVSVEDSCGEGTADQSITIASEGILPWERESRISKGDSVTAQDIKGLQICAYTLHRCYYGDDLTPEPTYVKPGDLVHASHIAELQNTIGAVLDINHFVMRPNWIKVKKGDKISAAPINQLREVIE